MNERKNLNYEISNDYFNYKHAVEQQNQKLDDQIELARVENEALKKQLDGILEHEKAEGDYSENLYAQKTQQFAARFRKSSKQNEQELNVIKVQYSEVQDKYLKELQELDMKIKMTSKRVKKLDDRRTNERSAFTNDIQALRKRVTDYERHIKRLKTYVDKEDTEALLGEL